MDYHRISIAQPSARVLGKMKRGHKVRVMDGEGMNLIVDPLKYNQMTKSFSRGSGVHISLSPEEIHHNHAEGIFSSLKMRLKRLDTL